MLLTNSFDSATCVLLEALRQPRDLQLLTILEAAIQQAWK